MLMNLCHYVITGGKRNWVSFRVLINDSTQRQFLIEPAEERRKEILIKNHVARDFLRERISLKISHKGGAGKGKRQLVDMASILFLRSQQAEIAKDKKRLQIFM